MWLCVSLCVYISVFWSLSVLYNYWKINMGLHQDDLSNPSHLPKVRPLDTAVDLFLLFI